MFQNDYYMAFAALVACALPTGRQENLQEITADCGGIWFDYPKILKIKIGSENCHLEFFQYLDY